MATKIDIHGAPFALIPWADYEAMIEELEDRADNAAADAALAEPDEGLPHAAMKRLLAGESAYKVFREARVMTQAQLGEKAGVAQETVSAIENRSRKAHRARISIAGALSADVEELERWEARAAHRSASMPDAPPASSTPR